jgi:hypothetical protein
MTVADDAGIPAAVAPPDSATIARFDPMLRSLITFGLVERDVDASDGEGWHWRLVPSVQHRLESLFAPSPTAEKLIYFGHRCGSCGEHGPTRFSSGVYLCEDCRGSAEHHAPMRGAARA